jgi:hypothetical protein
MFDGLGRIRRPVTRTLATVAVLALVAGCGSQESTAPDASTVTSSPSDSASQTASATASATEPTSLDADHIFGAAVEGYAFVELPKSVERQARRQFEASAGVDEDEAELDIRSMTKDGTGTSVVLVVTLSAEFAALPGTERGFAVGMAESAGTEPREIKLGGTSGYLVEGNQQAITAWQDHNLLVAVFAEQRAAAIAGARAIVAATS